MSILLPALSQLPQQYMAQGRYSVNIYSTNNWITVLPMALWNGGRVHLLYREGDCPSVLPSTECFPILGAVADRATGYQSWSVSTELLSWDAALYLPWLMVWFKLCFVGNLFPPRVFSTNRGNTIIPSWHDFQLNLLCLQELSCNHITFPNLLLVKSNAALVI